MQPICACARADLQKSRKMEGRLWLVIAAAAGVVIILSIFRSYWGT